MFLRSIIIGISITLVLVFLLVVSRILGAPQIKVIELASVDIVEIESPPPPPEMSEPDEPEDLPPPPTPKIELSISEDFEAPEIAPSMRSVDLRTPIQTFQTSAAPAALPIIRKAKPAAAKTAVKRVPRPTKPRAKAKPRPKPTVKKSYYSSGELDNLPRTIRTGSFKWPSKAKGSRGSVRLLLEINESGRVTVIKVASTSDPALTASARKVARGSKFTAPRKGGQKVKARFYKTYNLRKP